MSTVEEIREGSEVTDYPSCSIEYRSASHRYWGIVDDEREPWASVTSVLKVLDKAALVPWAERCGVEGALQLEREGELAGVPISEAVSFVRMHKLGADAKRDAGADRGTAIHDALQLYCSEAKIPNVGDFDPEVRGYVSALCKWLVKASPEPILVEQVVGSITHKYAGRLDLLADIDGQRTLVDLKTNPSGRVYVEAHLQAAAYCHALTECGIEPPDHAVIVAVGEAGDFQEAEGCGKPEDFLHVLQCHRSLISVRAAIKASEQGSGGARMSPCAKCNGRGWVKVGKDIRECPACLGKGEA